MTERILAIESSARAASCALLCGGRLEASAYQDVGLTHSRTLLPMVRDMLRNAGLALSDCGCVAVARGPGSFTGIRIGVAAAKGLALGAGLPCVGVSTLEAMAMQAAHLPGLLLCAMDARRSEVYHALFRSDGRGTLTRLSPDRAIPAAVAAEEAWAAALAQDQKNSVDFSIICIGDGAELCYNLLREKQLAEEGSAHWPDVLLAPAHLLRQSAAGVALCAAEALRRGETVPAEQLQPVYLRLSQAERERREREQAARGE